MADEELKFGARNNRNDQTRIQSAHDLMVENGAVCGRSKSIDIDPAETYVNFGGEIKAVQVEGGYRVKAPLVVFTDASDPDLTGDYFDATTDFDTDFPGKSTVYFNHGADPVLKYRKFEQATLTKDEFAVWAETILHESDEYEKYLIELGKQGRLGMSSGVPGHLVEREPVGKAMHIKTWPLGKDASFTHTPAEPKTRNVIPLKSLAQAAETAPVIVSNSIPDKEPNVADIAFTPEELQAMKDAMNKVDEMQETVDEIAKSIKAFQKSQPATVSAGAVSVVTDAADQPFKSTGEFLLAVKNAAINPAQEDVRLRGKKAITGMGEQVPGDGGYLVQSTVANGIVERMYQTGKIMSRISKDSIGPNSSGMVYNGIDETSRVDGSRWGGLRAYWLAEGGTKTASQPQFRQVELKLKKIAALAYATDELLQDATALEGWINRTVPQELNFRVEDAVYEGDGVGKPLGIMSSPALVSVLRADASKVQASDVLSMWARRWAGVDDYVWLINQDVTPQLQTMAGTYQYLWMPPGGLSQAPYSSILGRPVLEVEYASTMGTTGDIMLASLSQYQAIDKGGVQSASSIHVAFLTDQQVFRFVYRVDGAPMWHSPLTPFKGTNTQSPFVVLATASA